MSSVVFGSRDAFRPRSATPTAAELGCIAAKALAFEEYCEYASINSSDLFRISIVAMT